MNDAERPATLRGTGTVGRGRIVCRTAEGTTLVRVVNYTSFEQTIMFRSDPRPQIDASVDDPMVFEADTDRRTRRVRLERPWCAAPPVTNRRTPADSDGRTERRPMATRVEERGFPIAVDDVTGRLLRGQVCAKWDTAEAHL